MGATQIYNSLCRSSNPERPRKTLTREQVEARQAKAVRFLRDVKDDDDRADEVEAESPEEYAGRRKIRMSNPVGVLNPSVPSVAPENTSTAAGGPDQMETEKLKEKVAKLRAALRAANPSRRAANPAETEADLRAQVATLQEETEDLQGTIDDIVDASQDCDDVDILSARVFHIAHGDEDGKPLKCPVCMGDVTASDDDSEGND